MALELLTNKDRPDKRTYIQDHTGRGIVRRGEGEQSGARPVHF